MEPYSLYNLTTWVLNKSWLPFHASPNECTWLLLFCEHCMSLCKWLLVHISANQLLRDLEVPHKVRASGAGLQPAAQGGEVGAMRAQKVVTLLPGRPGMWGAPLSPPSLWQCPSVAEASHCCGIGKGARCPPRPPMAFWALRPKTSAGGTVHRSRKTPLALQVMMCTLCGSGNCFIM